MIGCEQKEAQMPPPHPDLHCAENRERKSSSLVYFKPKFETPAYGLTSVQAAISCFKQTNDTPVLS